MVAVAGVLAMVTRAPARACAGAAPLGAQRTLSPFQHAWALPGGFLQLDETVDEAAQRELEPSISRPRRTPRR